MDQLTPEEGKVEFSSGPLERLSFGSPIESYAFRGPGGEIVVSAALSGAAGDHAGGGGHINHVRVKNVAAAMVRGVDLLNGLEQELDWQQDGKDVVIPGVRVRDYPLLIRINPR